MLKQAKSKKETGQLRVPQKSRWQNWVELEALVIDDCQLECNGISWALSHKLTEAGIEHECMAGYVLRAGTREIISPHFWIELPGDWVLDLRLRMWLGDTDDVPHGLFHKNEAWWLDIYYEGQPEDKRGLEFQIDFLDCLTDGMIHQVEFSRPEDV